MTRSNIRFPSAQSAMSEGLQYLQAEADSRAWCYDYWAESVAPYQVILYSGDYHEETYRGFDMLARAWAYYDQVTLSPGDSLVLFDRENWEVVSQRTHTRQDEEEWCWRDQYYRNYCVQAERDEIANSFLTKRPLIGRSHDPAYCQLWQ